MNNKYIFGTPTTLLMRSDLILSRVPFYEERYAPFEDAHACFDLLKTWNFGFVHQVLAYSRRDNESILSRIVSFGYLLLSRLMMVVAHGRDYLSEEEYARCLKDAERQYFLYLAKSACALRRPGLEFWEFHRRGLASVGYSLDWRLLWMWFPRAFVEKRWDSFWRRWDKDVCLSSETGSSGQDGPSLSAK